MRGLRECLMIPTDSLCGQGQRIDARQMPECSHRPEDRFLRLRTWKIKFDLTRLNGMIRKTRQSFHGVVESQTKNQPLRWSRLEADLVHQPSVELRFEGVPQCHVKTIQLMSKQAPIGRHDRKGFADEPRNHERFSETGLEFETVVCNFGKFHGGILLKGSF